jgi:hypothetical protein
MCLLFFWREEYKRSLKALLMALHHIIQSPSGLVYILSYTYTFRQSRTPHIDIKTSRLHALPVRFGFCVCGASSYIWNGSAKTEPKTQPPFFSEVRSSSLYRNEAREIEYYDIMYTYALMLYLWSL